MKNNDSKIEKKKTRMKISFCKFKKKKKNYSNYRMSTDEVLEMIKFHNFFIQIKKKLS